MRGNQGVGHQNTNNGNTRQLADALNYSVINCSHEHFNIDNSCLPMTSQNKQAIGFDFKQHTQRRQRKYNEEYLEAVKNSCVRGPSAKRRRLMNDDIDNYDSIALIQNDNNFLLREEITSRTIEGDTNRELNHDIEENVNITQEMYSKPTLKASMPHNKLAS